MGDWVFSVQKKRVSALCTLVEGEGGAKEELVRRGGRGKREREVPSDT